MLVDSHCHIHLLPDYPECIPQILDSAQANQLQALLNVATALEEMPDQLRLAEYDPVYISIGVHPNEHPGREIPITALRDAANAHPKVIAIGETGLDYYRQDEAEQDLSWQKNRFITHIQVALETNKPLIIHSRHARQDTIDILRDHNARDVGGVMHCFTEDWDMAKKALDLGFYISLSGIVTFKNAIDLQDLAKKIPSDRFLIETDCPYLAPVPFRGKPNQPAYLQHTAQFIADLRGEDYQSFAEHTTENFNRLFLRNFHRE